MTELDINNKFWWFVGGALIAYGAITSGVAMNSNSIADLKENKVDKEVFMEVVKRYDENVIELKSTLNDIKKELKELNQNRYYDSN